MQAAFLDLDGTLIDPVEGITKSIQYALEEMGAEVPRMEELTWCIGPPIQNSMVTLLGQHADIDEAVGHYRERFASEGMFEADVYDGIGEMLVGLQETGATLWIATSKPLVFAQEIAQNFGLMHYLDGVFGSELDGTLSDKPSLLAHALNEVGADPARCIMLGDRRFDVEGAQANDIPSIGALWGYGEGDELRVAEADALAGDPSEVVEIASDLLGLD